MRVLIFGGVGFVGLNIAERFLRAGDEVVLFDRAPLPETARAAFSGLSGALTAIVADVTDAAAVTEAIVPGVDVVVMGAAITAGSARDAADPEAILRVNLLAQVPILRAAAASGVRRVINLSSAAAYGAAGEREPELTEETPGDPAGLYAITKWASERVGNRLGGLWGLDVVSLRLSGVFGPWERATGVRDTLSPHCQILAAAVAGEAAILPRPGLRDWIYAPDVADAVHVIAGAPTLRERLYNISTGLRFSALDWGIALAKEFPGFLCRLAEAGEEATIDLHGPGDRAPLAVTRMADEFGWQAATSGAESAAHLAAWWRAHGVRSEASR
ncbi:NAD-dependent epimerase/dehydratase family protein [Bosea sp. PAMC 26642]|uniref:NAD-dependent epimerase/dehydratase family protein n=1 Tax=Bosea sp. (strain PAMC 26642) TaxID=1792307 RepID=UPI00077057FD|nr:NAD(P)-dependent oxidoreductase [Bosea sp. PAMC 26642]AMJ63781.1 short-chain dehydrogenase [Bosea sp. PAMC 26642]